MKVFEIFPQQESFMDSSPDRCRTCAVVGNSVNLLGSQYGPLIDFHDVIMRFNTARTVGYEGDVGSKTTLHIMYPESAVDLDDHTHLILFPFKIRDLEWLVSAFTTKSVKMSVYLDLGQTRMETGDTTGRSLKTNIMELDPMVEGKSTNVFWN
ncbi:unnamed protein product [Arctogadus glacialis]